MNKFNRTKEESNFPTGWVCPKCGRVHAPHISGGYYQQASKIGQEITELLSAKRKALTEAYKTLSNEKRNI